MSPISLEVTTRLTEPILNATLEALLAAGLICRQRGHEKRMLSGLNVECYLLSAHASDPR